MFPKSEPSVKTCFGSRESFGLEWTEKALFKKNRKNRNCVLHETGKS